MSFTVYHQLAVYEPFILSFVTTTIWVTLPLMTYYWRIVAKEPSINYVVLKSAIFDPLPLLVVFLLS